MPLNETAYAPQKNLLLEGLKSDARVSWISGIAYASGVELAKWGIWFAAAANALLGIASEFRDAEKRFSPLVFTICAMVGAGLTVLLKATTWRKCSGIQLKHREEVEGLIRRLKFEQLEAKDKAGAIAAVSRSWTELKVAKEKNLSDAKAVEDKRIMNHPPRTHGSED